jgi:hypothetical protein
MVSLQLAALASLAVLSASPAQAATCATAPYGKCGSNADGLSCCPDKYYCQPWDAGFFQCLPQPAQCTQQLPNIDLYGNDIKTVYGLQPDACCTECTKTPGCKAYTFVNSNPGQPACYLKNAVGTQSASVGAVSGIVNGGVTPPPPTTTAPPPTTTTPAPPGCATADFGKCGDSNGTTCCPKGFYCQPWNPTYYQCVKPPARCSTQLTDTDFYGNDIKTVSVSLPTDCCDACAATPGCKAYTYVNYNPGSPACYLKSSAGTPTRLVGGVSGTLN